MRLILASGSPRRRKILSDSGYEFDVIVPEVKEDIIPGESPSEHVLRISRKKALSVASDYPEDLVLGADTVVVLADRIFGKPETAEDAFEMLNDLSGKKHTVYTGLTIINVSKDIAVADFDSTDVTFNELTAEDIEKYILSGEPLDKAGAYGIQGMGSFLVREYDGELDTVIGFPFRLFERMYGEALSCQ